MKVGSAGGSAEGSGGSDAGRGISEPERRFVVRVMEHGNLEPPVEPAGTTLRLVPGLGRRLERSLGEARFPCGAVFATPEALDALEGEGAEPAEYLRRHLGGDFGEVPEEIYRLNERASGAGASLFSSYRLASARNELVIRGEVVERDADRLELYTDGARTHTLISLQGQLRPQSFRPRNGAEGPFWATALQQRPPERRERRRKDEAGPLLRLFYRLGKKR
jgi:hypothetical protein